MNENVKIGLVGVGLNTYWPQFAGLEERLNGYRAKIRAKMEALGGVTVVDGGLVDDPQKASGAAQRMKAENVGILFIYISTYALSSTILPVVRGLGIPVVLLNIQPAPAIDYERLNALHDRGDRTGEWLANCQACSVPEFACVFNRAGIRYDIVSGYLDDPEAWAQIGAWIDAVRAVAGMARNRMGVLGHYYGGMLDVYSDLAQHSAVFGTHVEIVEMCELKRLRDAITEAEIECKLQEFTRVFEIDPACTDHELRRAAQTSAALDRLAAEKQLGSLAYYYEGVGGNDYEQIVTSVIAGNTLLTGRGIPVAGECEVKNVQAMKIFSLLGAGGSFSEFYGMDFNDGAILLGHDGPANPLLGEGGVKLVPLSVYHGKPGNGLSIQMSVRQGPVTLLSVVEGRDGISLLAAEGTSVAGPTLQIGNVNSRYKFSVPAKEFIERWSKAGPSHHLAIGIGHKADVLKKFAFLLDIPITVIG